MSVKFKARKRPEVEQELKKYELLNSIHEYHNNLLAEKEYRQIKKVQRKFSQSKGWRGYIS